jgi:hypothetical protein
MKFFTVTYPILGTIIKQNGRGYVSYSVQSSLIRSITKARSLGMFGTAQRVPGRSPGSGNMELRFDGYDRLWVCKLNMFDAKAATSAISSIILTRSMAYSIPKS